MLKHALLFALCCLALLTQSVSYAQSPYFGPGPGQASRPAPPPAAAATASPPAESAPAAPMNDYRLGVGDQVRVTVYSEPDLSGQFAVNANGMLDLPLIGTVSVLDQTGSQAAERIQTRLADGYLVNPKVSIEVLSYRPFFILGEVNKPGEYPYSNGLTLLAAVAQAGGYTYRANKKKAFIKHAGGSAEQELRITPDLLVQPGDTIRVGERYF